MARYVIKIYGHEKRFVKRECAINFHIKKAHFLLSECTWGQSSGRSC